MLRNFLKRNISSVCVFPFFITRIFDFVWKLQHLSCHLLDYEKVFYTSFLICLLFAFCSFIHSHTDAHILFVIIVFFSFVLRSDSPLFKFNQLMILLSGLVRFFCVCLFYFCKWNISLHLPRPLRHTSYNYLSIRNILSYLL